MGSIHSQLAQPGVCWQVITVVLMDMSTVIFQGRSLQHSKKPNVSPFSKLITFSSVNFFKENIFNSIVSSGTSMELTLDSFLFFSRRFSTLCDCFISFKSPASLCWQAPPLGFPLRFVDFGHYHSSHLSHVSSPSFRKLPLLPSLRVTGRPNVPVILALPSADCHFLLDLRFPCFGYGEQFWAIC